MTLGDLRREIEGLPDSAEVLIVLGPRAYHNIGVTDELYPDGVPLTPEHVTAFLVYPGSENKFE